MFVLDEDDKEKAKVFEERDKTVLISKGQNHFDILPEGWIQVTHNSGMPLYLHKTSRVCTLARPYFLGPGSVRVSYITKLANVFNSKTIAFCFRNTKYH